MSDRQLKEAGLAISVIALLVGIYGIATRK